ncbi:hypothetical protein A6R68_17525 [Neotoma lepida]|uniref:Beta-defensin n=1 Tax=Neotoma lepida TaxID=56216 RepID=A0A1A6HCN4_NEOLE|nr:hypothetical protein A6R68_17525 [Neotoma lepida]
MSMPFIRPNGLVRFLRQPDATAAAAGSDAQKCWNLLGKCRQRCSRKESVYVYCTNGKMCCVKPRCSQNEANCPFVKWRGTA